MLHRPDVVDGAVELLDAEGLDGITMRKLGAALNVQAGALYRHFESKEALLDAIAERLLAGVGDDIPEGPWPDQLLAIANRLRSALLAHRDGARVVSGTYVNGTNTLTAGQVAVEILGDAGLPAEQAGWLTFAMFYYVLGHTIEEQAQARLPPEDTWRNRISRTETSLSPSFTTALDSVADADPGERFAYGMRVFLNGIAHELTPDRGARER